MNIISFIILNMCFVCSQEPFYGASSFEYLQQMFWLRNNKSKKDSNDQESIQSSITPVPGYQMGK